MMANLSNNWANGLASAKRVNEIFNTVPEVQDGPDVSALPVNAAGRVVFENVNFHYNGNGTNPSSRPST